MTDLLGKTIVITGANTGIGKATATGLAARGATVILACRSMPAADAAAADIRAITGNERVETHQLDLGDLAATARSAAELSDRVGNIDVLINNAGVAGVRGLTKDGFELAFGVNHLGHFLWTTELLAALGAPPSRVVTVSSESHRAKALDLNTVRKKTDTVLGLRAYDRSKLCNVLFTQELARRHDPKVLAAFAVQPGMVASDIWNRRLPQFVANAIKRLVRMRTVEEGAVSSVFCASEPGIEGLSGRYFDQDGVEQAPHSVATPEEGARLWERSKEWVAPFRIQR